MIYQVVTTDENGIAETFTASIHAWAEEHAVKITETNSNCQQRKELQGEPKLQGFCGPMFGGETQSGDPIIRYEDTKSYAALSQ